MSIPDELINREYMAFADEALALGDALLNESLAALTEAGQLPWWRLLARRRLCQRSGRLIKRHGVIMDRLDDVWDHRAGAPHYMSLEDLG